MQDVDRNFVELEELPEISYELLERLKSAGWQLRHTLHGLAFVAPEYED